MNAQFELHHALLELRAKLEDSDTKDMPIYDTLYPVTGICSSVQPISSTADSLLWRLLKAWPEGTGWRYFPVPAVASHPLVTRREAARLEYSKSDPYHKWSPDTTYGAARRRLLDYLIEETAP